MKTSRHSGTALTAGGIAMVMVVGLAVIGVVLVIDRHVRDDVGLAAAQAALALVVGAGLGGMLKILLSRLSQERETRERQREHLDGLEASLKAVHERVEVSRELMAAHKSALTYGQQLRDLSTARSDLLELKRAAQDDSGPDIKEPVETMVEYFDSLMKEYTACYKTASDRQRFDEETNKALLAKAVSADRPEPPTLTTTSWDYLVQQPVLSDLVAGDSDYQAHFVVPYEAAVHRIREAAAEIRS